MRIFCTFFILFTSFNLDLSLAKIAGGEDTSVFSGRISKINDKASLMRVRVRFKNAKFLNKKDRVEFWSEVDTRNKCASTIIGKSSEYLLLRVQSFGDCVQKVGITVGSHIFMSSDDLKKSIEIARELMTILLKKRIAIQSSLNRNKAEVSGHMDKVEAINKRYSVLRDKLEMEWGRELSLLEKDKESSSSKVRELESELDEINHKLEIYRISDTNLELDRWSLDANHYYKK